MFTANLLTGALEANYFGTLVSVSDKVLALKNEKKTPYRLGVVKLPTNEEISCKIWEKSFQHGMVNGEKYRCTATKWIDDAKVEQIDSTMSHLQGANRGTAASYAFLSEANLEALAVN